jgi:hypothetical protein
MACIVDAERKRANLGMAEGSSMGTKILPFGKKPCKP